MTTPTSKTEAFRAVFEQSLTDIANQTGGHTPEAIRERCIILSGGVDTCAIMAAARNLGIKFGGALVVVSYAALFGVDMSVWRTDSCVVDVCK